MTKKYELLQGDTVTLGTGETLYRIRALRDFADVAKNRRRRKRHLCVRGGVDSQKLHYCT